MHDEGKTIRDVRHAIRRGRLQQPFRAAAVNCQLKINYAGTFLSKHCDERPDRSFTWLFDRVGRGVYQLNRAQQAALNAGR
jgi:hypothetical protein